MRQYTIKQNVIIFSLILAMIVFIVGCSKNISPPGASVQKMENYSITTLQDYDANLCGGSSTIKGGYEYIGLKLEAYDAEFVNKIETKREGFNKVGGTPDSRFSCFLTDPAFNNSVSVVADGYIPVQEMNIGSLPVGKMYLVRVAMHKKPSCYYDKGNLENYYKYINQGFGLNRDNYTLNCMDSDITRGGFVKAQGIYSTGGNFELFYRWGWCSSGGTDCGSTKCFAVEGNDNLFGDMKTKLCNGISSQGIHDSQTCNSPAYDNTNETRQKCLSGEFEYAIGNKKIISIIQTADRCSSSVQKGSSDCVNIQ